MFTMPDRLCYSAASAVFGSAHFSGHDDHAFPRSQARAWERDVWLELERKMEMGFLTARTDRVHTWETTA